jgi:quercetin 2,3-dioxygenase
LIERRAFESLSGHERDWLKAKHHFSLDDAAAGWGALCIWNDDEIAPTGGFPLHPHINMEIITYVREGAISHRDSLGNRGRIVAGDVQVMSAGTGIRHYEFNLGNETACIFQIWIKPTVDGGSPAWGMKRFPKSSRAGRLVVLASGFEGDGDALPIRALARVLGATLIEIRPWNTKQRRTATITWFRAKDRCWSTVSRSRHVMVQQSKISVGW